jgi:hypothetical protein
MNDLAIVIPVMLALSVILVWLLYPRKNLKGTSAPPLQANFNEPIPAPRHFRYFRQIRQALSAADAEYLLQAAPRNVSRQALRERRHVALGFLKGLHEDFSNISRLGRVIAALSPEISHKQEAERLKLTVKFQLLYAIVWLRLSSGNLPVGQLERLTGVVGRLAARMDEAMAEISAQSAGQFAEKLGA